MLLKLQRRTLVPSQIVGYAVTIFLGFAIILVTAQFYFDIKPLLTEQTDIFKNNAAVVSKNISVFKSMDKSKIYFTDDELEGLNQQPFIKNISKFSTATFKIKAHSNKSGSMPVFYTDLFFESIPVQYLDVETDEWEWDASMDFIPIIIPENYLNLYNFGFAESQGLPVLSKNTIAQIEFNITASGNYKTKEYRSKIVGFSNKVNSILVPEPFLAWANQEFSSNDQQKTSRILMEFNDPSDPRILEYLNENNYEVSKDKLELSKLAFFFKSAMIFVVLIAIIIIVLSIAFILLSLNLIIHRNKETLNNLYFIGYNYTRIARFYQSVVSIITIISISSAITISFIVRNYYLEKIGQLFDFSWTGSVILTLGFSLLTILLIIYNILIVRDVKNIVVSKK